MVYFVYIMKRLLTKSRAAWTLGMMLSLFLWITPTEAATLFMLPREGEFHVGQTVEVEVKVKSRDQAFNAAQATLQFSKDVLEVKSVDYSSQFTIFNFWIEEPKVSAGDGAIAFLGGTTNGVTGDAVPLFKITFRAKGSGEAWLTANDAAITSAAGDGANILEAIDVSRLMVKPVINTPPAAPASEVTAVAKTPLPPSTPLTETVTPKADNVPNVTALTVTPVPEPEKKSVDVRENPPEKEPGISEGSVLAIAGLEVTQFWFFMVLGIVIVASFSTGWFSARKIK